MTASGLTWVRHDHRKYRDSHNRNNERFWSANDNYSHRTKSDEQNRPKVGFQEITTRSLKRQNRL